MNRVGDVILPAAERQVFFYFTVAGIRLGDPLGRLLGFAVGYRSGEIDFIVRDADIDIVAGQRRFILQSILNLRLEVAGADGVGAL